MDRIITYMDLVNLNIPNKEQVADEILSLPEDDWYWIKFHGAWMCSLYNARSDVGWFEQFSFNPNLAEDSASVTALRDYIFPYIGGVGNVTVIKTKPGEMLNDHVDSAPDEVGGMQHKFRWVVKGKKESTLYFFDENSNKHYYEPQTDAYVINGSHPHGMTNTGNDIKLTVCIGSPWQPNKDYYSNIKNLEYTSIPFPKEIKKEWNDPRFDNENKIGLGVTEFKQKL